MNQFIRLKCPTTLPWLLMCLSILGCGRTDHKKSKPDVGTILPDLHWSRFDQVLMNLDTTAPAVQVQGYCNEHAVFCDLFFKQLLLMPYDLQKLDASWTHELLSFMRDPLLQDAMQKSLQSLPPDEALQKEFGRSTQYFQYYFPNLGVPRFYTCWTGFGYGNFIFESDPGVDGLGISLEFFAGPAMDYKLVDPQNPVFSNYLTRTFNADHLLSKTWDAWLEDKIPVNPKSQLLDFVVQRGKKVYILEHLLPEAHDTVLFEYTPQQLKWCRENKQEIWSYFLSQKLLYTTEMIKISKYIHPSPNAPGMPPEAPGRTASFIGYELVKAYMKNHPEKNLMDLLQVEDSQTFLQQARFKPRND